MTDIAKTETPRDARQSPKGVLTRQRIIEAASQLMHEDANAEVTIPAIAQVAGMSKGSVYYYFADAEEIVSQVLRDEIDSMIEAFERVALSSKSAYDALLGIIQSYLDTLMNNVALTRFVMGELHGASGHLSALHGGDELVKRLHALVSTLLERGKVEGSVRPGVDSAVAGPAIMGAFLGVSTLASSLPNPDPKRLAASLLDFIGFGISTGSGKQVASAE